MKFYVSIIFLLLFEFGYAQTIVRPICTEYRSGFICSDSVFRAYNNASTYPVTFPLPGSRKVIDGAGGFNNFLVIANDGTIWINHNDFTTNWTQFVTDSSGGSINNVIQIDAMANTQVILRNDSSIWYGGDDTLHLLHTTGGGTYNFVKISGSIKFRKVLIGFFRVVGLTTSGQVYEWVHNSGSITPSQKTISGLGAGYAVDIWTNHYDYAGCIIPNAGETSGCGWPYVWGSQYGVWGGNAALTQPTSVTSLWGLSSHPIKKVCANWNSTHIIDSLGNMYGLAYSQTNGELGNGVEYANKYNYPEPYSWPLDDGEYPSGTPMVQIASGIKWKNMWSNTFFTFYKMAMDSSGNLYFWGRDKAMVSGRGYLNEQEATYPNAFDVVSPTIVNPLTAARLTCNFSLPSIGGGSNQNVSTSSATLTATGFPALLINTVNTADTVLYFPSSWSWTQTSGPSCTITSPNSKSTTVTGMANGTYQFQVLMTDNNGGTAIGTTTVTVNIVTNCNCVVRKRFFKLRFVP